jgi:hypothetical protein
VEDLIIAQFFVLFKLLKIKQSSRKCGYAKTSNIANSVKNTVLNQAVEVIIIF